MRSDDHRTAVGVTARESERDVSASFPYTALSPSLLDSLCRQCGHLCHLSFFFCHRSSVVWVQLQEAVQRQDMRRTVGPRLCPLENDHALHNT